MNFENVLVKKPWGEEYEVYHNDHVSLWHLVIKPGQQTSLHCHPNKKTGLIVLKGCAELSFLSGVDHLKVLDKRIIRASVFHSTKNSGSEDLHLFEVETPNNKLDLLRLEDNYQRAGTPYESKDNFIPNTYHVFNFSDDVIGYSSIFGSIYTTRVLLTKESSLASYKKILILDGTIFSRDIEVAGPGDIIDINTYSLLINKFNCNALDVIGFGYV